MVEAIVVTEEVSFGLYFNSKAIEVFRELVSFIQIETPKTEIRGLEELILTTT